MELPPMSKTNPETKDSEVRSIEVAQQDELSFSALLRETFRVGLAATASNMCYLLLSVISVMFAGQRFGTDHLAGFSLAMLTANVSGFSILMGFASSLDAMFPKMYGKDQLEDMGHLLYLGGILCMLAGIPVAVIWWYASELFTMLGQPELSSELASAFLRALAPSLPGQVMTWVLTKLLTVQGHVSQFVYFNVLVTLLHGPMLFLFASHLELGFKGIAMAHVSGVYVNLACIFLFIRFTDLRNSPVWVKYDHARVFQRERVIEFIKLGVPGIFGNAEWWFWEVVCFLVGLIGVKELAAHSIAYAISPLMFMFPLGISIGLGNQVGLLVSRQEHSKAVRLKNVTLAISTLIIVCYSLALYFARDHLIMLFTQDLDVRELTASIWPYFCYFLVFDAIAGILGGVMRSVGEHLKLSVACVITLFVFGIPMILYMEFTLGMGLLGVWKAECVLYTLLSAVLMVVVDRSLMLEQQTPEKQYQRINTEDLPEEV